VNRSRPGHLAPCIAVAAAVAVVVLGGGAAGCVARPLVQRAEEAQKAGDSCEATAHYLDAGDAYQATGRFVRWLNRLPERKVAMRREAAARQCALETRRRVLDSPSPDGERELRLYDRFFTLTRSGTGVEPTLREAIVSETRVAVERYRREALGERDGLRNYEARERLRKTGPFASQEVKALLFPNESPAEYHLALANEAETSHPARAYFHHRMAEHFGAAHSDRTEALLARLSQSIEPKVVWRYAGGCDREARELTTLVAQGGGDVIEAMLDLRQCTVTDERWNERVAAARPTSRIVNEVKTVEKETRLVLGESGYVESDRRILSCDWKQKGTSKETLCRLAPDFYQKHQREYPEVLQWRGDGPFVFHWKEETIVPVQYDASERELRTVRRWRVGYQLDGVAKLQWEGKQKDAALQAQRIETESDTQYAEGYEPEVAVVRRKVLGDAAQTLRRELLALTIERHLARARAAKESGRVADAEEAYLLAALVEPTAREVRKETADWLRTRYGLEGAAARELLYAP
jgi:hypothetical protein